MLSLYLNFNSIDYSSGLFSISRERINELTELWNIKAKYVGQHYIEFSQMMESNGELVDSFHSGKVLKEFLTIANNPHEELLTLFSFFHIMELCQHETLYFITNNKK